MNADLLAMLGGAGLSGGPSSTNRRDEGKSILSFKAGKMTTTLQPNGKYLVKPDNRRGEINLTWTANPPSSSSTTRSSSSSSGGMLKFEWKDRRTRTVVDSYTIFPEDDCTYEKINTGRDSDRVYLLQYGNASERRFFFWMQDKNVEEDEENCVKVNKYMSDSSEAAAAAANEGADGSSGVSAGGGGGATATGTGGTSSTTAEDEGGSAGGLDNQALMQIMQGLGGSGTGTGSGSGGTDRASGGASSTNATSGSSNGGGLQVDALSNILRDLGMPQQSQSGGPGAAGTSTTEDTTTPSTSSTPAARGGDSGTNNASATPAATAPPGGGRITLADLQGAMAGLATTSPTTVPTTTTTPPGPPLQELATPDAVIESGILNDPHVKNRLLQLLPENQQTESYLLENLRSPQVSQTLRALTSTLMPDPEDGNMEGFHSIIANFQLRGEDGHDSLVKGNPIQAFLDCVLKDVERKKKEEGGDDGSGVEESKEAGGGGGGGGGGKESGDDKDGDAKMEEDG